MITPDTPYKLVEIIHDTWPNLYRPMKPPYNKTKELMNKYNTEDYFSVINTKTGRKILDCGEEQDAQAMVALDPSNRTYTRNKFLMGQVIDVVMPKELPTTNISVSNVQKNTRQEQLGQIKLPEGQQEPFVV